MKFFVSGSIAHKHEIREIFAQLQAAGHTITHDWTRTDSIGIKRRNPDEAGRRAEADLVGVMTSDVYVLDSSNEKVGKFMYGELATAITAQKLQGTPSRIYIIGPLHHDSILYYHDAVKRVATLQDVLADIA